MESLWGNLDLHGDGRKWVLVKLPEEIQTAKELDSYIRTIRFLFHKRQIDKAFPLDNIGDIKLKEV